jgi:hypothetical protein
LLTGVLQQLSEFSLQTAPADQTQHLFGVFPIDKRLAPREQVWYRAYGASGAAIPTDDTFGEVPAAYHVLALLAAGLQAAGPDLTPTSFASGLRSLGFPNPGAADSPYYQATVGITGPSHTLSRDVAFAWWDANVSSQQPGSNSRGGFCYADRGRRYETTAARTHVDGLFDARRCR